MQDAFTVDGLYVEHVRPYGGPRRHRPQSCLIGNERT
jgi:hypothetical protein